MRASAACWAAPCEFVLRSVAQAWGSWLAHLLVESSTPLEASPCRSLSWVSTKELLGVPSGAWPKGSETVQSHGACLSSIQ